MIADNIYEGVAQRDLESAGVYHRLAPDLQKGCYQPLELSRAATADLPSLRLFQNNMDITDDCHAANFGQSTAESAGSPDATRTARAAVIEGKVDQSTSADQGPEPISRRPKISPEQTPSASRDCNAAADTAACKSDVHGEVGAVSVDEARKRGLPEHIQQADNGFGTAEHPVNNNCQTATLKNMFNFYGQSDKASDVNHMEEQLLDRVSTKNGAGIDKQAFGKISSDYEPPGSPNLLNALNSGQIDPAFVQDVHIKVDGKDVDGKVVTAGTNTLMLSELGTNPEKVDFGKGSTEQITNALKAGKPVLISDTDTSSLRYMANGIDQKEPGHTYMIFQKDGKTYCSDPSSESLFEVPQAALDKKLNDASSYGIILNSPPDTEHFLKH